MKIAINNNRRPAPDTRRYHGLLCAATIPPVGRIMTINRIAELLFRYDPDNKRLLAIRDNSPHVLAHGVDAFSVQMEPMRSPTSIKTGGSCDLLRRASILITFRASSPLSAYNTAGMKSFYAQYDGDEFPTQDHLFPSDQLLQFITQYGDQALKAIEQMLKSPQDPQQAQLLDQLIAQGLLDRDALGKLRLTPRAINRIQRRALAEVFANLPQGQREGHTKTTPGQAGDRIEGAKPYTYGDNVSELDIHQTLHNALTRQGLPKGQRAPTRQLTTDNWQLATDSWRIRFTERDFELHLHEGATNCSTVILLDQSGSMMRYGRFIAAKQVALAMQALVRSRFPQDTLDIVGFYSGASFIRESFLPLAMPKPVTIYDYHVRLRVPLAKLEHAPQHFTNLHMGLQLARRLLQRRPSQNKQIFIITDGQPTAHLDAGYVYLLYPPDPRSTLATLKEGALALRDGCRICTFALIEDYWGMDWVGFVDQLTKLTKGLAFYTSSANLSTCIMESYLSGRKKKTHIA